jgi:phosphohistidine phosphatase
MKEVYILRHAEAVRGGNNIADFDRQLSPDGISEARRLGKKCREQSVFPGFIYCSPAKRALKTAEIFAGEINFPHENIILLPRLYESHPDELMDLILASSEEFSGAMIVGHNPVLTNFLNVFTIEGVTHLPTGTLVNVSYPDCNTWKAIKGRKGSISFVW